MNLLYLKIEEDLLSEFVDNTLIMQPGRYDNSHSLIIRINNDLSQELRSKIWGGRNSDQLTISFSETRGYF